MASMLLRRKPLPWRACTALFLLLRSTSCAAIEYADPWNSSFYSEDELREGKADLCQFSEHATVLMNQDTLYVFGGRAVYGTNEVDGDESSQIALPNNFTRSIDLSSTFSTFGPKAVEVLTDKTKLYANGPDSITVFDEAHLWPVSENLIYAVSGARDSTTMQHGKNQSWAPLKVSKFEMYQFDTTSSEWSTVEGVTYPDGDFVRSFGDGGVWVDDLQRGYLLGGYVSGRSDPASDGIYTLVDNLVVFDKNTMTWENKTGPDGVARARSMMFYVPAGEQGMLVVFPGCSDTHPLCSTGNFDYVKVYDIANDKWFRQSLLSTAASGIPDTRIGACGTVVSAPDNSSHQIVIFGGHDDRKPGTTFGDVHVLSLPSFQWFTASDRENTTYGSFAYPGARFQPSCQLYGGHYLLSHGGRDETRDQDIGKEVKNTPGVCDTNGVFLFDLNTWDWADRWSTGDSLEYKVHSNITSEIGGDENGGATKKKPEGGFDDEALADVFSTSPSGSSGSSKSGISPGVIAGAVVGSVIGALAVGGGFYAWTRHVKRPGGLGRNSEWHKQGMGDQYGKPELDAVDSQQEWQPDAELMATASVGEADTVVHLPGPEGPLELDGKRRQQE